MLNKAKAFLHIGPHRTGTTSIQWFLQEHRALLQEFGYAFFQGRHRDRNHVELHAAAMLPTRSSPFLQFSGVRVDDEYRDQIRLSVRRFLDDHSGKSLIFSAEGLSYLRYPAELAALSSLLEGLEPVVLMFPREREGFLRSYRAHLDRRKIGQTDDQASFAYVAPDSWVCDWRELERCYSDAFGAGNVRSIPYEQAVDGAGNIIPAFLKEIGLEFSAFPKAASYRLNGTAKKSA